MYSRIQWVSWLNGLTAVTALVAADPLLAADRAGPPEVLLRLDRSGAELQWSVPADSSGDFGLPILEVQQSTDLRHWQTWGPRFDTKVLLDASRGPVRVQLNASEDRAFYRLLFIWPKAKAALASEGEEVFGFADAFTEALAKMGQIPVAEFAERYSSRAEYLPGITQDPTTARYWDLFSVDPVKMNQGKTPEDFPYRKNDYRLNADELALFKKNGFVVSERLGTFSFADALYRIWEDDLPVFISTDAILQAWHRSYDMLLRELEQVYLYDSLQRMLDAMAAALPQARSDAPAAFPQECFRDVDYFLTVARSLLAGKTVPAQLGTDGEVAETLDLVRQEQLRAMPRFFGSCRVVDFSQFKPRGHYTETEELSRYFQATMWCGRTDAAVAGGPYERCFGELIRSAPPREMGIAIVLWHLLKQSGQFDTWQSIDRVIQAFVGWTDSMTFAQLGEVLAAAGIQSLADVPDVARIEELQAALLKGSIGVQNIGSDFFVSPLGPDQVQLPRAFTVLGQKFVPDSWAFGQTVYDRVIWDEDGTRTGLDKVQRRVPSALDVAFSVLGNNQVVPELLARMTDAGARQSIDHAVQFRDGLPYQHNLAAVREVIDQLTPVAWQESIYMGWLSALRELSAPTTAPVYPEAMRTRAWAMKTLNTQLASWTHLRHDTLLYAKQSYTYTGECYFPDAFVEPRPSFWASLRQMALRTGGLINSLRMNEAARVYQQNQLTFLTRFADTVAILEEMSKKELAGTPFTREEQLFVRNLLEHVGWESNGSSGAVRVYTGWYPDLFYRGLFQGRERITFHHDMGCDKWDLVVADVHTDLPAPLLVLPDPGSVLHEGIGNVHLLLLAAPTPEGLAVFAGPVLSHFEFEVVGSPQRQSDEEWKERWQRPSGDWRGLPNHPSWTQGYLVGCPR